MTVYLIAYLTLAAVLVALALAFLVLRKPKKALGEKKQELALQAPVVEEVEEPEDTEVEPVVTDTVPAPPPEPEVVEVSVPEPQPPVVEEAVVEVTVAETKPPLEEKPKPVRTTLPDKVTKKSRLASVFLREEPALAPKVEPKVEKPVQVEEKPKLEVIAPVQVVAVGETKADKPVLPILEEPEELDWVSSPTIKPPAVEPEIESEPEAFVEEAVVEPIISVQVPAVPEEAKEEVVEQVVLVVPAVDDLPHRQQRLMYDPIDTDRRLSRILVSELVLYNEKLVSEGRSRGNLYQLLQGEIYKCVEVVTRSGKRSYLYEEFVEQAAEGREELLGVGRSDFYPIGRNALLTTAEFPHHEH